MSENLYQSLIMRQRNILHVAIVNGGWKALEADNYSDEIVEAVLNVWLYNFLRYKP